MPSGDRRKRVKLNSYYIYYTLKKEAYMTLGRSHLFSLGSTLTQVTWPFLN